MATERIFDASSPIAGVVAPHSATARAAVDHVHRHSSAMLFNHVMRSYYLGCLVVGDDELFDPEVVFLATTLHDLGLTEVAAGPRRFELEGADAARAFLDDHGFEATRGWLVWDTIALHTWDVNLFKEPEARVAQLGIMADAVGMGVDTIDPARLAEVLAAFPRLDFKFGFVDLLKNEACEKPTTHIVHPVHMIAQHCCYNVPIPNAEAMIKGSPFEC